MMHEVEVPWEAVARALQNQVGEQALRIAFLEAHLAQVTQQPNGEVVSTD